MNFKDAYESLFDLGRSYGFRPNFPEGMEEFLTTLVAPLAADSTRERLQEEVARAFVSYAEWPRWLQEPTWPVSRGEPMIFVGQLDRRVDGMDVSFYVFKDKKVGITKVITQVLG